MARYMRFITAMLLVAILWHENGQAQADHRREGHGPPMPIPGGVRQPPFLPPPPPPHTMQQFTLSELFPAPKQDRDRPGEPDRQIPPFLIARSRSPSPPPLGHPRGRSDTPPAFYTILTRPRDESEAVRDYAFLEEGESQPMSTTKPSSLAKVLQNLPSTQKMSTSTLSTKPPTTATTTVSKSENLTATTTTTTRRPSTTPLPPTKTTSAAPLTTSGLLKEHLERKRSPQQIDLHYVPSFRRRQSPELDPNNINRPSTSAFASFGSDGQYYDPLLNPGFQTAILPTSPIPYYGAGAYAGQFPATAYGGGQIPIGILDNYPATSSFYPNLLGLSYQIPGVFGTSTLPTYLMRPSYNTGLLDTNPYLFNNIGPLGPQPFVPYGHRMQAEREPPPPPRPINGTSARGLPPTTELDSLNGFSDVEGRRTAQRHGGPHPDLFRPTPSFGYGNSPFAYRGLSQPPFLTLTPATLTLPLLQPTAPFMPPIYRPNYGQFGGRFGGGAGAGIGDDFSNAHEQNNEPFSPVDTRPQTPSGSNLRTQPGKMMSSPRNRPSGPNGMEEEDDFQPPARASKEGKPAMADSAEGLLPDLDSSEQENRHNSPQNQTDIKKGQKKRPSDTLTPSNQTTEAISLPSVTPTNDSVSSTTAEDRLSHDESPPTFQTLYYPGLPKPAQNQMDDAEYLFPRPLPQTPSPSPSSPPSPFPTFLGISINDPNLLSYFKPSRNRVNLNPVVLMTEAKLKKTRKRVKTPWVQVPPPASYDILGGGVFPYPAEPVRPHHKPTSPMYGAPPPNTVPLWQIEASLAALTATQRPSPMPQEKWRPMWLPSNFRNGNRISHLSIYNRGQIRNGQPPPVDVSPFQHPKILHLG